ncbi:hypothetical protein L1987_63664 [Smallanthus sonchifolius]|uniref:Uncharacterized protein n=1 Tax=Smallanthus sonchifolius TaxID=185202 RepID=A0ACB9CDV7_9ASTR|nr:hypothetical protein L1987_63664 [Smallanthus sonchifolius]
MDSKEDTSLLGSVSVSSDKIESVNDKNGVDKIEPVNVVDSIRDDSRLKFGSDDETEGYVSGEEEAFETILDIKSNVGVGEGEDETETFSEASEFPVLKVGEAGDDAVKDELGFVENLSLDSNLELNSSDVVKYEVVTGDELKSEVVVVNGVRVTTEGDSVVEEVKVDTPVPGVAVVTSMEEVVEDDDEDEDVLLVGGLGDSNSVVKTPDLELVDAENVKVTSEGDSVVEAKDVDLSPPLVVTERDDETPGLDSFGGNEVKVTSEGDSIVEAIDVDLPLPGVAVVTKMDDETPGLDSVGGNDVKVTSEGDSVVEAIDVDLPLPGVAGVAVVMKKEEGGSGDVEVVGESGLSEKMDSVLEEVVDKEVVGVTEGKFSPLDVEGEDVEKEVDYVGQENGSVVVKTGLAGDAVPDDADNGQENGPADKFVLEESAENVDAGGEDNIDGSDATKQRMEELGGGGGSNTGGESSQDQQSQMIDSQIVTDSDDEDDEEDGKELFDSAALAALLKAAADGGSEDGNITFSSQDGSRLFTVERPAGLGPSLQALRAAPRPQRANIFNPSGLTTVESNPNLSEEERKKLEKLQSIRVKFLRLVHRLGLTPDEPVAAQKAIELESDGNDDLDFSVNILVMGKAGAGKSATINSIFGEEKTLVGAFQPATSSVKEIRGMVGGVMFRVFDTPGFRASIMEQGFNRSVLSSAKKFMKKTPADVVLYVDRLDARTRDHNDIPLLKTITSSLGPAIWRSAIVTFTHGASAPPEGSNGIPLSYEMFVTQRSHVVQQAIGQAIGDLRMMSPSLMNPVSLVENHQSCRKNREGQKVLPNGQTWRPQLLMLCYSIKILAEANSLSKPQDPYDSRKLFGFRMRSPPLPYMLSSMLQSRAYPKLSADQGGDGGDSDVDLAELTDSDREDDEDEYDHLPPFKPLKRSQLAKLNREQKKAYFDEYDYRVKLLQKKQWKEEVKRMKEMKRKGTDGLTSQSYQEEEGEGDAPGSVAVPLPDMVLPPSFDSDNPAYRFRFLEPTSQFLARPVLDTHGWDHDCGYDGVNVEQTLAIANRFPAAVSVQITKDKKDFSINLDSSVSAKHGEKTSSMAGFDIQPIGKQLAYIVRGETKFKNLKKNKAAAGISVTFLGENIVTGFKVEDQITLGRQYSIIGSAGTVRFQTDSAYGANIEVQRRELDYPIGQIQSTIGLSIIKWRGDYGEGIRH